MADEGGGRGCSPLLCSNRHKRLPYSSHSCSSYSRNSTISDGSISSNSSTTDRSDARCSRTCYGHVANKFALILVLFLLPARSFSIVTIPPSMVTGPPKGEVLYTVTHDPLMEPDPVTIHCVADAIPPPTYTWLKDDQPWFPEDEEDVSLTDGEGTITFEDPRPDDEGIYQCIASNVAGKLYSDKTWLHRSLLGHFPSMDARVLTVNLGEPLSIDCTAPQGYPQPSTTWLLQSSDGGLKHLDNSRITIDDRGTLRFAYVMRTDASEDALYACAASSATSSRELFVVQDEDGDLTVLEEEPSDDQEITSVIEIPTEYRMGNWVYLNVSAPEDGEDEDLIPSRAPKFEYVSEGRQMVLEGEDLQIFCIYSGFPTPTVQWTKQNGGKTIELAANKSVLLIDEVELADAGTYRCHPSNGAGEGKIHQFVIDVQSAPVVDSSLTSVSLPMGQVATFSCSAKGVPTPTIRWTRDGEPIQGGSEISFPNLTPMDKSVIACNASNEHDHVYQTAFLNVLSMPPEFEAEPEDTLALEGEGAALHCDAYGSPDPEISWYRIDPDEDNPPGDSVEESDELRVEDGDLYEIRENELYIKAVTEETVGGYRCVATNKFGQVKHSAEVDSRKHTSMELESESEAVKAGTAIELTCAVIHDEQLSVDVTWYKDDEPLEFDDRMDASENRQDEGQLAVNLQIRGSKGADSGVYTCKVSTSLEEREMNTIIAVEDVPAPPQLHTLKCENIPIYLKWSSGAENNAPILHFAVEMEDDTNPGVWYEADQDEHESNEALVSVRKGRDYQFRVVAVNRVGQSPPGEPLNCTTPPSVPVHHPNNITLTKGSATSLYFEWEPIEPLDQQGPDFFYELLWRELDDDEDEDDLDDDDDDEQYEDDDDLEWEKKVIPRWEESQARIPGLVPNTRYLVKFKAGNAEGYSDDEVPFEVEKTAPGVPSSTPLLRIGEVKSTSAVVMWTPLDNRHLRGELKGYQVNVFAQNDDESQPDDELDDLYFEGPVTRATLTGLDPFTQYSVRIRADNTVFEGEFGEPEFFWTREAHSSPVVDLKAKSLSSTSLLVDWSPPVSPNGKLASYYVSYSPREEGETIDYSGEGEIPTEIELGEVPMEADSSRAIGEEDKFVIVPADNSQVKLVDLEENTEYKITVSAQNSLGKGDSRTIVAETKSIAPSIPFVPVFTWSSDGDEQDLDGDGDSDDDDSIIDKDGDGDIDEEDVRNRNVVIGDTDGDGDVDRDDVLDTDGDGDIDENDVAVADIDNDGDVDEDDVRAADRDGDGDVDISDVGDEDGDGDFDGDDVLAADEDGDGDIDASDDDEEGTLLEDADGDGDIDADDVGDVDGDGDVDASDFAAVDIDNDGDVDIDDLRARDKDGDGDIDAADVNDLDGDGVIDGDDLEVIDRDGDGDVDRTDYELRRTFLMDIDKDGDIDEDDVMDLDGDGDIDSTDRAAADIDNDGDVDEDDLKAADRDGDGDIDAMDIGDEDNDGDVDAKDIEAADEDGDGDIDANDDDEEMILLEDTDNDGTLSEEDLTDIDGDGDVDSDDLDILDIDDDGDIDAADLAIIDKDNDGDVDAKDIADFDGDGKIDEDDFNVRDKDGDGDVDRKDAMLQEVFLGDVNDDGIIDERDVLDTDGDGDIDAEDVAAADIDDDGDVDEDDLLRGDRDNDGDIDSDDVIDLDGDGHIDEQDVEVEDRDGDGDIDPSDLMNQKVILGDTDGDGDVDRDDVLDTNNDGVIDRKDVDVADINNDGRVDVKDVRAGDRDRDGVVDFADIGDRDGDGDVDGSDVINADADRDGDIDASDSNGRFVILSDSDGDGDVDYDDVNGDGVEDELDKAIADVNNDGVVNKKDIMAADRDGDGDVDGADLIDITGDGLIDGKDLIASDRDGDGDVDKKDFQNRFVILKDVNNDGKVNEKDVLDTNADGIIDDVDIAVADIDGDGDVDIDDIHAADQDGDGDVDTRDIDDEDGDGDIDGEDVIAADRDGDGDIDAADDGKGIDIKIAWQPDFDSHPGTSFFVRYRPVGTNQWRQSPVEEKSLHQTVQGLDPYKQYEVQVVAQDGEFETPSEVQIMGPWKTMEENTGPTIGAIQEETFDPTQMTWFVIALIVAITMMLVICFSMWAYNHRLTRIAELRAALYEGYEPAAEKSVVAAAATDVEAGLEEEQPITAQAQRQQMAAMMRRQDTIQSVDSFASHDDDFAEYGDETMAIDLLNSVQLETRPARPSRKQRDNN